MTQDDNTQKPPVEAFIDASLKKVYADLVQDEMPDRFKDLLDLLKAQDSERKSSE